MRTNYTLSLIVPCYNEERTIEACINRIIEFSKGHNINIDIIVVDDASTDGSWNLLNKIVEQYNEVSILKHEKNQGKGAALRTGFIHAKGDFVGIQDADTEYDPNEYIELLEPLLNDKADVVYGSRYLQPKTRRVLYYWHTWMNKTLTCISNMFTNLDITDMETCYKLFRREIIQKIAPQLKENRFGFEPEVTAKVAQSGCRVYECAITYNPRTYEEGKKIGWKDGVRALYCILNYSAHTAPLPMQILIYFFIGAVSLVINLALFVILTRFGILLNYSLIIAFTASALCNYLLCIAILFRHKARWNTFMEIFWYGFSILIMGAIDYYLTLFLINIIPFFSIHWSGAKFLASIIGFIGNFIFRKMLVFPEKKKRSV